MPQKTVCTERYYFQILWNDSELASILFSLSMPKVPAPTANMFVTIIRSWSPKERPLVFLSPVKQNRLAFHHMIQNQKSLCNRFEIASKSLFDARNYMYKHSRNFLAFSIRSNYQREYEGDDAINRKKY